MDSKRTNFLPPTGSGSKSLKPRSSRKQDVNATLIGTESKGLRSISGSTSHFNQTVRKNLDITMFVSESFRSKAKLNAAANELEIEYDLAYNEYLQALMKQEIVKNTIKRHETIMTDQIIIYTEKLQQLKSSYEEIIKRIKGLKGQCEVIEQVNSMKLSMDELNVVCNPSDLEKRLSEVYQALEEKFSCVRIENINPLTNQGDYDRLIQALNNLKLLGEKLLNSERDFNQIKQMAMEMRNCSQLKSQVDKLAKEILDLRKKACSFFLRKASDMFAEKGGYL